MDDSDVALDAVAHEVSVGDDECALVAEARPPTCLGQSRHGLALPGVMVDVTIDVTKSHGCWNNVVVVIKEL